MLKLTKPPKKILIIKPSSLGDIVHSLPLLNVINMNFPQAEIHWLIASAFEDLLEGHPMIHKLWVVRKDDWKKFRCLNRTIGELKGLFKDLKKERFDIVIDLQGLLRSGLITFATRAPVKIGFNKAREGSRLFYSHKVESERNIHAVDRYLEIAKFLGCNISDICFPFPLFKKNFSNSFKHLGTYAVLVPGARWMTKRWPSDNFGKLSAILPIKTVIIGSKSDIEIARRIVDLSNGNAISLAGKTNLKELIEVIRGAKFAVSNDSGPMHIASALRIPVFALFGPTDPTKTGPYGEGHTVIKKEEITCSPCFKRSCNDLRCMKDLSVERVYEIIKLSFF